MKRINYLRMNAVGMWVYRVYIADDTDEFMWFMEIINNEPNNYKLVSVGRR